MFVVKISESNWLTLGTFTTPHLAQAQRYKTAGAAKAAITRARRRNPEKFPFARVVKI